MLINNRKSAISNHPFQDSRVARKMVTWLCIFLKEDDRRDHRLEVGVGAEYKLWKYLVLGRITPI
jgi:hypothetical protein